MIVLIGSEAIRASREIKGYYFIKGEYRWSRIVWAGPMNSYGLQTVIDIQYRI